MLHDSERSGLKVEDGMVQQFMESDGAHVVDFAGLDLQTEAC